MWKKGKFMRRETHGQTTTGRSEKTECPVQLVKKSWSFLTVLPLTLGEVAERSEDGEGKQ